MRTREHGFTIIELVVVIAILGILAAVALPKFADLTGQAKDANFDGTMGGFQSAVMIAHSAWLADGADPNGVAVQLEGQSVWMNANGWPSLTPASGSQGDGKELYDTLMTTPLDTTSGGWAIGTGSAAVSDVDTTADATFDYNSRQFTYTEADGKVVE